MVSTTWTPASWQTRIARQLPHYENQPQLEEVLRLLSTLPPLVTSWEVETLKHHLAEAAAGKRFLLQGGDCSESFDDCKPDIIAANLKVLLQMSLVLIHGSKKRVVRVGRFAGQYAKPRSSQTETRETETLPTYRGDLINRNGFTKDDRTPDPELLLRGYERSALTLNFIRALSVGGFADLHHPDQWNLDFVSHSEHAHIYEQLLHSIRESIEFLEVVMDTSIDALNRVDFFTSHEGLHLHYEQAQTRRVPRREGWYNLSTHFPWIGNRTRHLDGAHVEYFRGIRNPIGVKIGPKMDPEILIQLINILNPDNEPGKLTLIHRFGAHAVRDSLPPLIEAVQRSGANILWCCDPMHGNTETTKSGRKTRRFDTILTELDRAFSIHQNSGSCLGGVHVELTGQDVTECIGGARGLHESDLEKAYKSRVDPRLNYEQALELALFAAGRIQR